MILTDSERQFLEEIYACLLYTSFGQSALPFPDSPYPLQESLRASVLAEFGTLLYKKATQQPAIHKKIVLPLFLSFLLLKAKAPRRIPVKADILLLGAHIALSTCCSAQAPTPTRDADLNFS